LILNNSRKKESPGINIIPGDAPAIGLDPTLGNLFNDWRIKSACHWP